MSFDPKSLLAILDRTRGRFLEAAQTVTPTTGEDVRSDMGASDGEQYVDGFLALLREAAGGQGDDVRSFFLSTAIPPLIASGIMSADQLVRVTVGWGFAAASILLPEVPLEERPDAQRWLTSFFAGYVADIARVAHAR